MRGAIFLREENIMDIATRTIDHNGTRYEAGDPISVTDAGQRDALLACGAIRDSDEQAPAPEPEAPAPVADEQAPAPATSRFGKRR
jgi:hypothetical protein